MSIQTLNLTPEVYQYFKAHAYREPEILQALRVETENQFPDSAKMQISPEQGQFMHFLIKTSGFRKVLEIGTFTGYSSLWMALALPAGGKIVTCDRDVQSTCLAKSFWKKAGVENQVDLRLGPAQTTLPELALKGFGGYFDFAFIDAEKTTYSFYYEQCLLLVRSGGVIAIDNTLQGGRVADLNNQNPNTRALRELNDNLLKDSRVLLSMLPISDGLTLLCKL